MIKSIQKTIKFLLRFFEILGRGSIYLACILIASLVLLVFFSSVLRYVVGVPLAFADEVAALLFLSGSILTVTYGYFEKRLIRIELLWAKLPCKWKQSADVIGQLVAAAAFAVVVKAAFGFALDSMAYGSKTVLVNIVLWPWAMVIPLSLGLMALSMFLAAIDQLFDLVCEE